MTLLVSNNWEADIVDIETTFLYGELEEEIYIKVPEGLETYLDTMFGPDHCFLLNKAMYGLVQAARQFYKKFIQIMTKELGFEKCLADSCLLRRTNGNGTVLVCVYVDDTMCVGDRKAIDELKKQLEQHFSIKDEGSMEEYVGCTVTRGNQGTLTMRQPHLLRKIEKEFGEEVDQVRAYSTPAGTRETIMKIKEKDNDLIGLEPSMQTRYRSGVGILLYLVKFSRPDISNSVRELSKVMDKATESHYRSLLRTIKYVLTTQNLSLFYDSGMVISFKGIWKIIAFYDSDFA